MRYEVRIDTRDHCTEVEMELSMAELGAVLELAERVNNAAGPIDAPYMFVRHKGENEA